MKHLPTIAGALLGLIFVFFSAMLLFNLVDVSKMPQPPPGSAEAMFMGAFGMTGYMTFVKVLEMIGGLLVAVPKTRNFGLLVLGPIIINILAFHGFVKKAAPADAFSIVVLVLIIILPLYLLWVARDKFVALKN